MGERERIASHLRYNLLLREVAERDDCICGKAKGHVGWLVCVDAEHYRREDARADLRAQTARDVGPGTVGEAESGEAPASPALRRDADRDALRAPIRRALDPYLPVRIDAEDATEDVLNAVLALLPSLPAPGVEDEQAADRDAP